MGIKIIVKSLGRFFFVPLIINDVLIPLIVLFIRIYSTEYNTVTGIMKLTQMFTPFLASFWIYLHLVKYIDSKGNENFYVLKRNKLLEVIKLIGLYIITNTPFFIWYSFMDKACMAEWLHIVIMSIFFGMAAYFLCYLFRSISLGMIPAFIYALASVTGLNSFMNKISYYEGSGMEMAQLLDRYNYFLALVIVFAVIGKVLNDHYIDYNS